MPFCPECETFIDRLELYYKRSFFRTFRYDYNEQKVRRDEHGQQGESQLQYYRCPECHQKICSGTEEANEFLNVPELEKKVNEELENGT